MALDPAKNFAKVTVSIGYGSEDTSIVLSTGDGAKLPDPSVSGAFNLVWWNVSDYSDPADDPNKEIVRCTARSSDTLTVTRAQESTSATTKNTSAKTYKMILALTAKMITDIGAAYEASGATATHAALTTGVHGVGASTVAKTADITTHSDLTTGVHGVGAGTVAKTSDITATKLDDFTAPDDNTDLNASTSKHGLVVKATAPSAGLVNVVGIENGETAYTNKALFDATSPSTQAFGDSAATGTATVAARRDHKHGMPASSGATTALDNLASVAINTSLISDTDNTDDLGSLSKKWKDGYFAGNVYTDHLLESTSAHGISIDGLTIKDSGFVLGSDADGDMYYRSSSALARLAKGAANTKLFMNAGATAPEWSSGSIIGSFSRDATTASGTQAVTGVGFKPSIVFFYALVNVSRVACWDGFDNITVKRVIFDNPTSGYYQYHDGYSIFLDFGSSNQYAGYISSMDSDGFTISWTKTASPTGTIIINYVAFR